MKRKTLGILLAAGMAATALAQNVISAKAGTIQYVEGTVLLDQKPVEVSITRFPEMKNGQVLSAEDGRVEVLLAPGTFLRLNEHSSVRMDSNSLVNIKLELLGGSALLEVAELAKDTDLNIGFSNAMVSFRKNGLYRFDSNPSRFAVYEGHAVVGQGKQSITVKKGEQVPLDSAVLVSARFDTKYGDEFYRWASHRAAYVSMANVSSAKTIKDRGMSWTGGGWMFNPWYNMFTYIPGRGTYMSPFGFGFYSPWQVYNILNPYYYGYGNGYYGGSSYSGGGGSRGGGTHYDSSLGYNVGTRSASPSYSSAGSYSSSSPSYSAPAAASSAGAGSRSGGDSGGRGSSSGGGRGH